MLVSQVWIGARDSKKAKRNVNLSKKTKSKRGWLHRSGPCVTLSAEQVAKL